MMKKVVLALVAIVTVLFVGVQMSGKLSVAAESAENPENVLGVIEYEESGSKFREVDNLQEYRERLEQQGLSDYDIALNMLEVMGYTDEQIAAMTEEVILQNLPVKHSKVEIQENQSESGVSGQTTPLMTRALGDDQLDGLEVSVSYKTLEISLFEDGRDPENYLMITVHFNWENHNYGIPEDRNTDYIGINNNFEGNQGVKFQYLNAQYPLVFAYEEFHATYYYNGQFRETEDYVVVSHLTNPACRVIAFDVPYSLLDSDFSGYFQTVALIDTTITDKQSLEIAYGHTYSELNSSVTVGLIPGSASITFSPTANIATEDFVIDYRYVANPVSGVYILQNHSTSRVMEMASNVNTSIMVRSDEVFNKNNAAHRKNSKWQFRVNTFTRNGEICYSLKSVAYNNYVGFSVTGGGIGTYSMGVEWFLVGNQVGEGTPSYKIVNHPVGIEALASAFPEKALYFVPLTESHYESTWLFHEVADEDIGQALDSEAAHNLIHDGVYKIKNVGTGKYLEIPDYSINNETLLTLATNSYKTSQEFRIERYYEEIEIRPSHIGRKSFLWDIHSTI